MKKYVIGSITIICIVIIAVIYNLVYDKAQTAGLMSENTVTNTAVEEFENNEIENNIVEEPNTNTAENLDESTKTNIGSTVYEQDNDVGSTNKKEEAINLVKQKWGEDDTVIFQCDHVENNGEYIIAVVSKNSANVKNYFRVNLENKSVTVDY